MNIFLHLRIPKEINKNYYIMCLLSLLQGFVFYGPIATLYRQSSFMKLIHLKHF